MIHLDDFTYKETTRHGTLVRNKHYRVTCDGCGVDRGYQAKSYKSQLCNSCASKRKIRTESWRLAQSLSATRRYNDPSWKPKSKVDRAYAGQRRRADSYKKLVSDEQAKLRKNTRSLLWQKLKKRSLNKVGSTFDILGYTVHDLMMHLESQFKPGMTWDNYGKIWEIDHVVPDSWFKYSSVNDEGFKQSWSLSNLQPLFVSENRAKGAKLCHKR